MQDCQLLEAPRYLTGVPKVLLYITFITSVINKAMKPICIYHILKTTIPMTKTLLSVQISNANNYHIVVQFH